MFGMDDSGVDAGVDRLEDKLDAVSKVAGDMTPLWPKVGEVFAQMQRQVFSSGTGWPALDEDTVRIKGSGEILVAGRSLIEAATSPVPVEATRLYAKFGVRSSDVPYAHWHARGAGVPRRDPVPPMTPAVKTMILDIVAERVREELA